MADRRPQMTDRIDEYCRCGHLRTQHADRAEMGHGLCLADGCPCEQFTWAGDIRRSDLLKLLPELNWAKILKEQEKC